MVHTASGDLEVLDIIIQIIEEVMASPLAPRTPPKSSILRVLANVHTRMNILTGDPDYPDDAIALIEEAISLSDGTDHVELAHVSEFLLELIH